MVDSSKNRLMVYWKKYLSREMKMILGGQKPFIQFVVFFLFFISIQFVVLFIPRFIHISLFFFPSNFSFFPYFSSSLCLPSNRYITLLVQSHTPYFIYFLLMFLYLCYISLNNKPLLSFFLFFGT